MDFEDGKRMFGDLKSKLGFGSKNQEPEYDDYYDDAYDDYADDYAGYDDYAEDDFEDGYESYAPRAEQTASHASSDPYRVTSRNRSTSPRLVSIEDVRANARASATYDRDAAPSRQYSASRPSFDNGRTMVDSSLPPQMTPEGTAAAAAAATRRRSEGLDSLFTPTTEAAEPVQPAAAAASRPFRDPYESYSGSASAGYNVSRGVKVIKPASYADVEGVARALKAGDVVVLALGNTPEALSKRILDFSFGVASALDASVDAIANKVFAITKGNELTEVERATLRSQGVL